MTNSPDIYTAVTFAPVQGFIEKSRKLRDLYGSSFILSYLARAVCDSATNTLGLDAVISPATINLTQGTPNQIIIAGNFPRKTAERAFREAWGRVVDGCRDEIELRLGIKPDWRRSWNAWTEHAWEFYWAQAEGSVTDVRMGLNRVKQGRDWTGINWTGESSTLSGGDGVAYPSMELTGNQKQVNLRVQTEQIKAFYRDLSREFHTIIDETEQLSIPELIKRLITLDALEEKLGLKNHENNPEVRFSSEKAGPTADTALPDIEIPGRFRDLNRWDENCWTGWFQGDGDGIGEFLKNSNGPGKDEAKVLRDLSKAMINWGAELPRQLPDGRASRRVHLPYSELLQRTESRLLQKDGRIIYAGGDDFLGVLYRTDAPQLTAWDCLDWFSLKFPEIWKQHGQDITVSVGFVWAAPGVPQRDILQHCRETEKVAKDRGRDRLAVRVLFNGGNYLEWHCPWWFLPMLGDYSDRAQQQGYGANWRHLFEDVAELEARHGFDGDGSVALALFEIYFGAGRLKELKAHLWGESNERSILGDRDAYKTAASQGRALNQWVIALAQVGFHLHRHRPDVGNLPVEATAMPAMG
jgi:CRISPR-associated protein Cmr2